jgi:hypothetical protein
MRRCWNRLAASTFAAVLFSLAAMPAFADDFGKRFTIDLGPNFQASTTGDANPPQGSLGCIGCTKDNPVPNTLQFDYGLDFKIDPKTHLNYSHANLDFALGRILTIAPHTELLTGLIADYTNTIQINRDLGNGLTGRLYYYNHVRQDVTGECLNQEDCPNAAGVQTHNVASISEHGYGAGASYNFGPRTQIGSLFTVGFDAKYVPRPSTPPAPCGSCEGIGHFVGSQFLLPYSIQMKIPVLQSHTVVPFVGYERADVLFADETTPEMFNVINFGIVKVINKNLALSIVNLNFNGCRCTDTIAPPDNVRFAQLLLKLDIKTNL